MNRALILVAILFCLVNGEIVKYSLRAERISLIPTVDGFNKTQLAFNGEFPGPTIIANLGDTLSILVTNAFDEGLSVHWHGIHQKGSLTQDGALGVTQCPIAPGTSRTYTFNVNQTGTYWYHAHSAIHYGDGLYGALIIDGNEFYNYGADEIVMVADWYHGDLKQLFGSFVQSTTGNEPVPDNIIMNGIGQGYCNPCDYASITVPNNSPTLFRIINAAIFAPITVSLDGHYLMVVEVDGTPVIQPGFTLEEINNGLNESSAVNQIRLNIGQRVAVLVFPLTISGQPDTNSYWLRATMDNDVFPSPAPVSSVLGIVSYSSPYIPKSDDWSSKVCVSSKPCSYCVDVNDLITLSPNNGGIPASPDQTETIVIDFVANSQGFNRPILNTISCTPPTSTYYLALVQAGKFPSTDFPCYTVTIDYGKIVRMIFNNRDPGEHPMHLHGYKFWVLQEAAPDAGDYNAANADLNLVNPLYRDVATVNPNSFLVIQFVADNPGLWMLHCHIDWHMNIGFVGLVNIGQEQYLDQVGITSQVATC